MIETVRNVTLPETLNVLLAIGGFVGWFACLYVASHGPWWAVLASSVVFAVVNQQLYALQHEALHGLFHRRHWLNESAGILLAASTPIGFSMQRAFHLKHHRGNRSDEECFDLVLPGDRRWAKRLQFFGILSGEFWLHLPLVSLLWLFFPWILQASWLRDRQQQTVRNHGADAFLAALERLPPWRSRLEIVAQIMFLATACWLGSFTVVGCVACYAAFAFVWGGLQYATHAYSIRHVREGAWDLQAPRWVSACMCHYFLHRTHHRHPAIPWTHLPQFAQSDGQPTVVAQWWRMWRTGPIESQELAPQRESDPDDFMVRALRG